jgi:hypothetical protein
MRLAFRVAAPENSTGDDNFRMLCRGSLTDESAITRALLLGHELVSESLSRNTVTQMGEIANLLAMYENLERNLMRGAQGATPFSVSAPGSAHGQGRADDIAGGAAI